MAPEAEARSCPPPEEPWRDQDRKMSRLRWTLELPGARSLPPPVSHRGRLRAPPIEKQMGPFLAGLRGSHSATSVLDQPMSCLPSHPFQGNWPPAGLTLLTTWCIPTLCCRDSLHIQSALPLAPEAQFQKLLPLRLKPEEFWTWA